MAHDHSHSHGHEHSHAHHYDHASHANDNNDNNHVQSQKDAAQREVLRRLRWAMMLCSSFLVVEVIGGLWSGSLAVLSDAAHLFADLASFAVAIAAAHLASLPATDQHTFGLKRAESLAALLSMISLALVSIYLAIEAVKRFVNGRHDQVNGQLMSGVAAIGVLVNIALALVLGVENHIHLPGADHGHDHSHDHGHHAGGGCDSHHGDGESHHEHGTSGGHDHSHGHGHNHSNSSETEPLVPAKESNKPNTNPKEGYTAIHADELVPSDHSSEAKGGGGGKAHKKAPPLKNINLQAAYLHVFGDLLQSLGVLLAGLAIWYNPKWTLVDPICTLFFCGIVFYSTLGVLRHSVAVLLQEVPPDLSWQRIYQAIVAVEGVQNVHDLHVWSISHGDPALAVHCSCDEATIQPEEAMRQICGVLKQMGIHHITIQMQQGNGDCVTCQGEGCDGARLRESFISSSAASGSNHNNNAPVVVEEGQTITV